ncbi:hypothetical protein QBC40DRAFT_18323 [Triangularia verruculosa]|uniref:Uncharacterized protein n=1 Tax=Triangularia verruculosa TaxID=2587418 RepID=A0AAN6X8J5_9PEZI|nr:hypothetical protein QBC40DRAFT_18323 [Triangularia verruculosa]
MTPTSSYYALLLITIAFCILGRFTYGMGFGGVAVMGVLGCFWCSFDEARRCKAQQQSWQGVITCVKGIQVSCVWLFAFIFLDCNPSVVKE